jgi:hypothetical protein
LPLLPPDYTYILSNHYFEKQIDFINATCRVEEPVPNYNTFSLIVLLNYSFDTNEKTLSTKVFLRSENANFCSNLSSLSASTGNNNKLSCGNDKYIL